MSFKKLIEPLKESLNENGITAPTLIQKDCVSKIKSGADVVGIAPEGAGKSTNILVNVINSLKEEYADVPRALIMVVDKAQALKLEERFNDLAQNTSLRVFAAYEEGSFEYQKSEIYVGMDVVIATPRRMAKLYYKSGLNLGNLKMFILDDADKLMSKGFKPEIDGLIASLPKCQNIIFAEKMSPRLDKLVSGFMKSPYIFESEF